MEGYLGKARKEEKIKKGNVKEIKIKENKEIVDGSKHGHGRRGYLHEGSWEAIHLIEVGPEENGKAHYRLTSTVMLSMTIEDEPSGTFNLSGSIRDSKLRNLEFFFFYFFLMSHDLAMADGHLCNMGKMIEELEENSGILWIRIQQKY
ncbi:hypothetical protein HPP92_020341 [Vanilla planifolia]|uniref:F-actin-capping protein subunit beta n=1 Tax=Vanilla planifolia TaxID=51239 RepID=A0A835Q097_VANPL|nr:hypothetical protein HPP92_020341 [Vanilla planifolia]